MLVIRQSERWNYLCSRLDVRHELRQCLGNASAVLVECIL